VPGYCLDTKYLKYVLLQSHANQDYSELTMRNILTLLKTDFMLPMELNPGSYTYAKHALYIPDLLILFYFS
jgi:hypothetical protein